MTEVIENGRARSPIALRLKKARQRKGLSRREVAADLSVNVSAVVAWEAGKYLPRDTHRAALAKLLSIELDTLFDDDEDEAQAGVSAAILHGSSVTDESLTSATSRCVRQLNILRIAHPHGTIKHHQREFRRFVSQRILDDTLELQQVEIFYNLNRLQEVLSSIVRFEGHAYHIKTFLNAPGEDVFPGIDAYVFDGDEAILASYWVHVATDERPQIKVKGEPFRTFLHDYWTEAWRRATSLNFKGAQELGVVQEIALSLGLPQSGWPAFLEGAINLDIGDGAPPFP